MKLAVGKEWADAMERLPSEQRRQIAALLEAMHAAAVDQLVVATDTATMYRLQGIVSVLRDIRPRNTHGA
jgi:hypothetical protein